MHGRAHGYIPAPLVSTDRILQRWDVSIGSGLPSDFWDDLPVARLPPLDDVVTSVVDQIILHAPKHKRRIIVAWYRTPKPIEAIARDLRISDDDVINRLTVALCYMCLNLKGSRQPALLRLLRAVQSD